MANYPNLAAEMARRDVTAKDVAAELGIDMSTAYAKLRRTGNGDFKTREAFALRDRFFPNLTVDYLFESGKGVRNA